MATGTEYWHGGIEIMGMFDTNAKQVADEKIAEAQKAVGELEVAINYMKAAFLERKRGDGLPITYCERVIEKALAIYNDVARANGAILVRSTN